MKRQNNSWDEIRKMPRTFNLWDNMSDSERAHSQKYLAEAQGFLHQKVHESVLRSHSILEQAKKLLEAGTPGDVVLDVIKMLETELPEKSDT